MNIPEGLIVLHATTDMIVQNSFCRAVSQSTYKRVYFGAALAHVERGVTLGVRV